MINLDNYKLKYLATDSLDWHWKHLYGTWNAEIIQGASGGIGPVLTAQFQDQGQGLYAGQTLNLNGNGGVKITSSGSSGVGIQLTATTGDVLLDATSNGRKVISRQDFKINSGKTLTIGNTTLNETQLQQLLALIS